ncbi:hypothetical protein M406DRAFT_337110 [Cryphonectria parasitica EP155]|uniref:RBR-type E3 ubiquitin transferase n=1 Tax=Cryphonectria parasitica (strain ATCC 38755 / EP155) TaxID=660469 RepID=A0A9P4Y864_CRYP1|nr:uncharacterized protein M406DRAFT_337110 [Cryphonectria parasitica EP155]KAF3768744.1 hypothetical protein M406DRAFT_337110 [Cryphonectria parasitica EP155]
MTTTASRPCSPAASTPADPLAATTAPRHHASPRAARSRGLTFSQYDRYLAQVEPSLNQPKAHKQQSGSLSSAAGKAPSIFSVGKRRSVINITNGIKAKVRSCICCRDDFAKQDDLHNLPCGHTYCGSCLRILTSQATTDESKMPPRCCTQAIPGSIIKPLLSREEQQSFLKAVQQFSTPWEARIFCPNANCNVFIPPRSRIDPKHPFDVICRDCRTRVCTMCKMRAHPLGQDCPSDMELDQVLRMGEKSGWRRCYRCRTLVELSHGCTHMTCRCKAQFCYICGAIWDPSIGCPNLCDGQEELERRRLEEEQREAEEEAEKAAQEAAAAAVLLDRLEAEKRTQASEEFTRLKCEQEEEMRRFLAFERKTKWKMWTRHRERKAVLNEKYSDQTEKMRERHAKTEQHLEERQIAAEIDLRASLEQAEKSVRIRVKHMEAYCKKALGRAPLADADANMPPRVVTEKHLRELGQQHNALEGMARLHQARINVLRDRQAKRMEELLERQEKELEKLGEKREEDIEDLAAEFAHEEDELTRVFDERRMRLVRRWELAIEILRVEMEKAKNTKYAPIPTPKWPDPKTRCCSTR